MTERKFEKELFVRKIDKNLEITAFFVIKNGGKRYISSRHFHLPLGIPLRQLKAELKEVKSKIDEWYANEIKEFYIRESRELRFIIQSKLMAI